ncbi:ABC transporter substrate-binding protein [Clostridia bacterium]|nr:ABC transporter substrate-binding protein [Clostridia bacterium]
MKTKRLLVIVMCLLMVFALAACGKSTDTPAPAAPAGSSEAPAPAPEPEADAPLVGISVPNNPTGWVGAVQWISKVTADSLGLNYVLVTSENPNDQANKIDELIQQGCEYIVLFPDNDELAVAAQKIMDAGIVLINFDRTLGSTTPDYYLAGNNEGMGVIGAQYISEKLGDEGGNVVIMNIPNYGEIFTERVNGAKSVFDTLDNITVIGEYASDNGAPETVLPIMADILTANPKIDAIYSTDDEMSQGILQAIKEAGRTDIKVVTGGGGAQSYFALMDEYPDIWVSSQTYAPYMMADAIKLVPKLIAGEAVPARTIIPPVNVDRDNYKQYMADNNITSDAPY